MAEIDKALPNVDETIEVSQEEIEQLPEPQVAGPTNVVTNEDGSVDINFEENQMAEMPQDHFANLADFMLRLSELLNSNIIILETFIGSGTPRALRVLQSILLK